MLHTHDEFLRAIESQPAEQTVRLVYADWLDEQNDPRAELVRVEEEMRQAPVYSGRFWELKPRRDLLRERFDPEWCGRMHYGTSCAPVFQHGIPEGWRERWRLIREFIERWHHVPMDDVGGRADEIAEVETRLGRVLPPSVREWVALSHDAQYAANCHAALRNANDIRDVPGQRAIALWLASDAGGRASATYSAVLHSDLALPDPPVYRFLDRITDDLDHSLVRADEQPEAETVSAFALRFLPHSTGEGGGFQAAVDQPDELRPLLKETFSSAAGIGADEVYELDNLIVWLRPPLLSTRGAHLIVAASPALARDRIPPFLLDRARQGYRVRGVFLPDQPRTGELVPAIGNNPVPL
jgi:uncharacterized protein (TIGR02996 family)